MRTLWELKGIEWPSQSPEPLQRKPIASSLSSVTFSSPLFTRTQLEPSTVEEEEEQLAAALKESTTLRNGARTNVSETITQTLSIGENVYEIERTQLNDAANALLNLSELKTQDSFTLITNRRHNVYENYRLKTLLCFVTLEIFT